MAPTFASAAAAAATGGNSSSSRADQSSEWPRRANGATQTFRRTSQAPSSSATTPQRDTNSSANNHQSRSSSEGVGVYIPPHVSALRNGVGNEQRYPKDILMQLFKILEESGGLTDGLDQLLVGAFQPSASNGAATPSWGARREDKESQNLEVCWDRNAHMFPLTLNGLTEEEKELFTSSVNSPIKPPAQTNKDATPKDGASHRKASISQSLNSPGAFGLASPTQARPGNRRRETSEAYPFPNAVATPGGNSRFQREESPAQTPVALLRRRTDRAEPTASAAEDRDKEKGDATPFGGPKRSVTGLGVTGSTSTWGSPSTTNTGFAPMGAFGNFAIGANAAQSPVSEKRPGFGSLRGQSRFANLMKDSTEDHGQDLKEKSSMSHLNKTNDHSSDRGQSSWMEARQSRPISEDTDPYPEDDGPSGSATLGGHVDDSPLRQHESENLGGRDKAHPSSGGHDDFSHQTPHHVQHRADGSHEPMSPTNTNPYQSPEHERTDLHDSMDEMHDMHAAHLPGLGLHTHPIQTQMHGLPGLGGHFGALGRNAAYETAASDRSQTSSVGPQRGFPSLGGFGGLPGLGGASPWSAAPQQVGTPTRERSGFGGAFGEGLFSSAIDAQSPVLAGLGNVAGFGSTGGAGFGNGRSKMGALFPQAMPDQMRMGDMNSAGLEDFEPFGRQQPGVGSFARGAGGPSAIGSNIPNRDSESPFRNNRGLLNDMLGQSSRLDIGSAIGESAGGPFSQGVSGANIQTPTGAGPSHDTLGIARTSLSNLQQSSSLASPGGGQPPAAQLRTMVMPDRMKWIYKDPSGSTQGPWSGLEMHDWYRAGFFTPELLIKRVEDTEFEPLAQLIRRIGNSREPFLVPQIGIQHEPSTQPASQVVAGTQPPFPNSFPSFGTTLTAEQQNALERRKQEEQFLMARQKEHLAQQQIYLKQQIGGAGQPQGLSQLNHHSSAHSLQSQPSFGSIASPAGYQASPTQGSAAGGQPLPGLFDGSSRQAPGPSNLGSEVPNNLRGDEMPGMMERLSLNRGLPMPQAGKPPSGHGPSVDAHSQQVATMLHDRARLQHEQAEHNNHRSLDREDLEAAAAAERMQQFHDLRLQSELDVAGGSVHDRALRDAMQNSLLHEHGGEAPEETLTQQVQAASAAKEASAQRSPWAKIDSSAITNQRPPQSTSPMPAPIAQRKQNVADNLVAESRSQTQSPAVETPSSSIAPWANQVVEAPKTKSLREIQEAEAKRAAKQEELAAAQRRAAYEKELAAAQAAANIAPAPGLPSGATWGSQSPAVAAAAVASSAWGSKTSAKPGSKTLQQIQKEEESKKIRAAAAAAAAAAAVPVIATATVLGASAAGGKRYADLAGKVNSPSSAVPPNGSWTTVGASGKTKALPSSPVNILPGRSVSGTVATLATPKPTAATRSTTLGPTQLQKLAKVDALEEFKKWATAELQRGQLYSSINANDFVDGLLNLGNETDIITEAVHSSAQTIDSRHFAEEFVRRKRQADKGIIDPSTTASPGGGKAGENAWSAVAKKGQQPTPPTQEQPFKLAKVKGRRK